MDPVLKKFFRIIAQPDQTIIWCRQSWKSAQVIHRAVTDALRHYELWGLVERETETEIHLRNRTVVIFTTCDQTDQESRGRNNVHIF